MNLKNEDLNLILSMPKEHCFDLLSNLLISKSQIKQDLFVLSQTNFKRKGFFVDFGASNGIDLSNSYLLEKNYDWQGILAEPCRIWHESLFENRKVAIETKCVWKESNQKLLFNQTNYAELSTIDDFSAKDSHAQYRQGGLIYEVETISLNDLLAKYNAPYQIDYLSIDTEGSELDILENFNWDRYSFEAITVEHNYTINREKIYRLLENKGYKRKFVEFSLFDDWYVKNY